MIVSMDKQYTWQGRPFTVVTTTMPGGDPVVGHDAEGRLTIFNAEGRHAWGDSRFLVEVSPYADFVIDEPVMVRDYDDAKWSRCLFIDVNPRTGLVNADIMPAWVRQGGRGLNWQQCRRPTKEELAK